MTVSTNENISNVNIFVNLLQDNSNEQLSKYRILKVLRVIK